MSRITCAFFTFQCTTCDHKEDRTKWSNDESDEICNNDECEGVMIALPKNSNV